MKLCAHFILTLQQQTKYVLYYIICEPIIKL